VLEFEFENGKLNKIKLGFGVGKRKKLLDRSSPPASTQTSKPTTQGANPSGSSTGTGSSGGPPNKPLPPIPTSGGSKASGPVASGQTSAGGGNTAATSGGPPTK
jgi:hypothetical protein